MSALTTSRHRLLGVARIALGTVLLIRTTALANLLPMPLAHVDGPLYGWPRDGWPIAWAGVILPDGIERAAAIARTVAAVAFLIGVRGRLAGTLAGALGLLAMSQDPFGFIYTLYTLFLGTIVLANTDATSMLALRPDPRLDVPSSLTLVRVVVASIYVWAAIAKMRGAWLDGRVLLVLAEERLLVGKTARLIVEHAHVRIAAAWTAMAAELGIGLGLLFDRTRLVAIGVALVMHGVFEVAARPDVMGLVMASLLVACAATPRVAR